MDSFLDLIHRAKSGDAEAFGTLYDMTYDSVYQSIFYRVLDDGFTEDIISEVYMKAMRQLSSFRGDHEWSYLCWLKRIAYHTLIDTLRYEEPIVSIEGMELDPSYTVSYDRIVDARSDLARVIDYLSTLTERERLVITLHAWDGHSYDEISEILGISVANAKQIYSRTLAKITANITLLLFLLFSLDAFLR